MHSSPKIVHIFSFIISSLLFFLLSCSDEESKINGYWKLEKIRLPNQTTIPVDSQFYAFQKKSVFSLTRLIKEDEAEISYGYADFPEERTVHIVIDRNHAGSDFPQISQWLDFQATFTIEEVSGNALRLMKGDTLFILKRH
jgi:hypothetical protein